MTVSYSHTLSPQLAQVAKYLHQYANYPEGIAPEFIQIAFEQITRDTGVNLSVHSQTVLNLILSMEREGLSISAKPFMQATQNYDFDWSMYDTCIRICKQYGYDNVSNFVCLEPPELPNSVSEGLAWLTVSEMKPLLKSYEQKVTGKRDELEARLIDVMDFESLRPVLEVKLQEKMEKHRLKVIADKYEQFARMVKFRAMFLYRITQQSDTVVNFVPKLLFLSDKNREQMMAKELDGSGFADVIVGGKVHKMLPLFCGSLTSIKFEYVSTNRATVMQNSRQNFQPQTRPKPRRKRPIILLSIAVILTVLMAMFMT